MHWEGASCQNCFPTDNVYTVGDGSSIDGEASLERRDMSKLFGRNISTTEHNLYRSLSFDASRAKIHDMVENAVSTWTIPAGAKKRIVDSISIRVAKELKHGDPKAKQLIASLLREEAAALGLDIMEVTRALAVMGLNGNMHLRQASQWLVVACLSASFRVLVGETERGTKSSQIKEGTVRWSSWLVAHGYPCDAKIFRTRVPLYLSDAIDPTTEIKIVDGVILDYSRKRKATLIDHSALRIKLEYERSFYAFKSMKKILLDQDTSCHVDFDRTSYARKFMLEKGRFPLSTELARIAGCSLKMNAVFLSKFREKKSEGRSWKTVAIESLREADEEIFCSLPRLKRGLVLMTLRNLMKNGGRKLGKQDLEHTGIKGLLVLSEFDTEPRGN